MRDALIDRDTYQASINRVVADIEMTVQMRSDLEPEVFESIIADMGDLQADALKVTQ